MNHEATVELITNTLLCHDTASEGASYCICSEKLWAEGKPGMARHRAERIVAALGGVSV